MNINDRARQRRFTMARWQPHDGLSNACNSPSLQMQWNRVRKSKAELQKQTDCKMAEDQARGVGRVTRSKTVTPVEKGKSTVQEAMQRVYLDIPEDSEEEFDIRKFFAEEEPHWGGRGKVGMGKAQARKTGDSEEE